MSPIVHRVISLVVLGMCCLAAASGSAEPVQPGSTAAAEIGSARSFAEMVWTNYIARTNGRDMRLWARYTCPPGWPKSAAPILAWNPHSLITAYSNYTGISQCWEGQVNRGQVPVTLLTRRHAYTRGHDAGAPADGQAHLEPFRKGQRVWFVTPENQVVEARIANWLTRLGYPSTNHDRGSYCDYSLMIFSNDLPSSIKPLKAMRRADCLSLYASSAQWPRVILKTEQGGYVSAGIPPFNHNTWKGGDSGSPDMVPIGDWLVFIGGRATTGPTEQMQADMDTLTRSLGLATNDYQLDWVRVKGGG